MVAWGVIAFAALVIAVTAVADAVIAVAVADNHSVVARLELSCPLK